MQFIPSLPTFVMCKVYTDVGGIKYLYHVWPPVRKIIHVQADNPWYNYYLDIFRGATQ